MNTDQIWQTDSPSVEHTLAFASDIGHRLRGGDTIELVSDLGGGKTTFVRGLAAGMLCADEVHSPSFTVSNVYQGRHFTLYHFDFYRLTMPGIMRDELKEALDDDAGVVVVEWGEIVKNVLPKERLIITIQATGNHSRRFMICCSQNLKHRLL